MSGPEPAPARAAPQLARRRVASYPERLVVYVEDGTRELLDELAEADHLSLGAYLRRLVMAHTARKRKGRAT